MWGLSTMPLILLTQTHTLDPPEEHLFLFLFLSFSKSDPAPGVWELQVDDVQHLLPVCAVVVIDKLLQLHPAVGLLGDVHHVHTHIRTFKHKHQNSEGKQRPLLTHLSVGGFRYKFDPTSKRPTENKCPTLTSLGFFQLLLHLRFTTQKVLKNRSWKKGIFNNLPT